MKVREQSPPLTPTAAIGRGVKHTYFGGISLDAKTRKWGSNRAPDKSPQQFDSSGPAFFCSVRSPRFNIRFIRSFVRFFFPDYNLSWPPTSWC